MAPASRERVDHILENYLLALACADQCSLSAPDEVKSRLAANLEKAERVYADAAADGLVEVSGEMEADLHALAEGNQASRARLHGGASIVDLLSDLEGATERADRVLRLALARQAKG